MKNIIFLHGGTLNKHMWLPQIAELENEFTVYSIDLPRHGENISIPFSFDLAVQNLALYIESKNMSGEIVIVGLSLGGYVAIEYAKRFPGQISGLILSGCCTQYFGFMGMLARISALTMKFIGQKHFEKMQKKSLIKITSRSVVTEICKGQFSQKGGEESMAKVVGRDFVKGLNTISVPILLLNGEHDTFNRKYEHMYLEGNSNVSLALVLVKDSGHLCSLEEPQLFSQFIRSFMNKIHT